MCHRAHDEGKSRRLLFGRLEQRAMIGADQPQIIGAAALHVAQVVGVIDDAGEVGVLVVDADRRESDGRRGFHRRGERGWHQSSFEFFLNIHASIDYADDNNLVGFDHIKDQVLPDDEATATTGKTGTIPPE